MPASHSCSSDLRLPAIKHIWPRFAERADKEGWPAARFLAALAEHEIAERARRRIERHLAEARLPPGKTLDAFDFDAVPMISKAQVMALVAGDSWLEKGDNLRAHREPPVAERRQILAHRPLVQLDPEPSGDPGAQVLSPPAHHPVRRRVGTCLQPGDELGDLPGVEIRGRAPPRRFERPAKPLRVVAGAPSP